MITYAPDAPAPEISHRIYSSVSSRLDPEVKAKWVEALRSGRYKQGQHVLQTPDGKFCCLGVYCDIAGVPMSWGVREYRTDDGSYVTGSLPIYGGSEWGGHSHIPPGYEIPRASPTDRWTSSPFNGNEFIFEALIPSDDSNESAPYWGGVSLTWMNDKGFTFAQIADVIDYFL